MVPRSSASQAQMVRRGEPDPEDPHFVHEETRQLASEVKGVIEKHFQRHGTNEQQIVSSIKQFGVSQQSKLMLAKEKAAAEQALHQKIYGVWRNENARHAINRDYCSRVGPLHKCFCGHTLEAHAPVSLSKRGPIAPRCQQCPCDEFRYIPNEPEEVGEHWLSRRPGFVPGAWVAKCRCGHGSADHDPSRRGGSCNACRNCYKFDGHFLCVVCDGKFHDHITLFETEEERRAAGRPVKGDFIPLKDMDWEVNEIVFGNRLGAQQIDGNGHALSLSQQQLAGSRGDLIGQRPSSSTLSAMRTQKTIQTMPFDSHQASASSAGTGGCESSSSRRMGVGTAVPMPSRRPPSGGISGLPHGVRGLVSSDPPPIDVIPPHCSECGTVFRTAASKFCSNCGAKR